jgi:hypothetical protein
VAVAVAAVVAVVVVVAATRSVAAVALGRVIVVVVVVDVDITAIAARVAMQPYRAYHRPTTPSATVLATTTRWQSSVDGSKTSLVATASLVTLLPLAVTTLRRRRWTLRSRA